MKPSKFQQAIYDAVEFTDHNLMISAVAGSGKTTTIEHAVKKTPKEADKAFLAFNNSIVEELKKRIIYPNSTITTMHSLCWRAIIMSSSKKIELQKNKSFPIVQKLIKKYKVPSKSWGLYTFCIMKVLDLARMNLLTEVEEFESIGFKHGLEMNEEMCEIVLDALILMNKDYRKYDFTDMIYRACIDEVRLPKFDFIFVDESQDLSAAQQYIISAIKSKKGRMIAVGDPRQAIYGFAGADANSYNNLKTLFPNTIELPLSVNYRCGKRIVKEAQKINPHILPFDKNDEGEVRNGLCEEIKIKDWVLCRNLKPLVILNLFLISKGVRSYIRGVEIGKNLENYIKSFGTLSIETLFKKIDEDINKEIIKLRGKGVKNPLNTEKIDRMIQQQDVIKIISINVITVKQLLIKVNGIFKEQPKAAVLSTIHKAKGLENDRVFFLCPELIPSKYATQPWQMQQENNLAYVAITRAKKSLIYIEDYSSIEKVILDKF